MFAPGGIVLNTPNLQLLSLNGCSSMTGTYGFSSLTSLKSMDLRNTGITGVNLPQTATLTSIQLPSSLVALSIQNMPGLAELTLQGYASLETLVIDETPVGINTRNIILGMQAANAPTTRLSIKGVSWEDVPVDTVVWLLDIADCRLEGVIGIYESSVATPAINTETKKRINLAWGNVDDAGSPDHNGLLLTYARRAVTGASVIGNFYNDGSTTYQFGVTMADSYQNAFTKVMYAIGTSSLGENGTKCTMNPETGLLTIERLSSLVDERVVTVTITTYNDGAYGTLAVQKTIELYDRKVELGDIVYYDGTYSSPASYDGSKTPIGVCCFIAPRDSEGNIYDNLFNPSDKQTRLMLSLHDITAQSSRGLSITSWQWGAFSGTNAQYSLYEDESSKQQLSTGGLTTTTFYDIPTIANLSGTGLVADSTATSASSSYIGDNNLRDESSDDGLHNGGFKPISAGVAGGDGFAYGETQAQVEARTLDASLKALAGSQYNVGDVVNSGYAKTLKLIQHRNYVLATGIPGVGIEGDQFAAPAAGSNYTELESLANAISNIREWAGGTHGDSYPDRWSQILWPAASAAYAYQPTVRSSETLDSRFAAHNWFLPPLGLVMRLYWYRRMGNKSSASDKARNIFYAATNKGVFTALSAAGHWCSTESGQTFAWYVSMSNGNVAGSNKYYSMTVRAVAAF